MKLNTTIKTLCAAVALAASAAASATPFYINNTPLDSGVNVNEACPTCTSIKTSADIKYSSVTTVTDLGAPGISIGDTTSTNLGITVGTTADNRIIGFTPDQGAFPTSNTNNGLNSLWQITFGATDLLGFVNGIDGVSGLPTITYTSGTINLYYQSSLMASAVNFMDIILTNGGNIVGGSKLVGNIDFSDVDTSDPVLNNLFNLADGRTCNGKTGYFDIWSDCGLGMPITFDTVLSTRTGDVSVTPSTDGLKFVIAGSHESDGIFNVPEPASLALLGAGLLGLGAIRRRKSA